jgi:hypothetical protein
MTALVLIALGLLLWTLIGLAIAYAFGCWCERKTIPMPFTRWEALVLVLAGVVLGLML